MLIGLIMQSCKQEVQITVAVCAVAAAGSIAIVSRLMTRPVARLVLALAGGLGAVVGVIISTAITNNHKTHNII
jgi:hypothetical protein